MKMSQRAFSIQVCVFEKFIGMTEKDHQSNTIINKNTTCSKINTH